MDRFVSLKEMKASFKIIFISFLLFFSFPLLTLPLLSGTLPIRKMFERSYNLYQEGKYQESIELANQVLSANSRFYPAYNLIGFNRIREEINILDAVYYFKKSLEIEPAQPQIYNVISAIYNGLGNQKKGYYYLKEGARQNPDDFQLNYSAGLTALLAKQEPLDAVSYLKRAAEIKPNKEKLLYLLGASYLFSEQKEMTLDTIIRLRKIGSEGFARQLEGLMRSIERGEPIDLWQVREFYTQESEEQEKREKEKKESGQEVEIGTPQTTIKGRGTIQIRRRLKPAE